MYSKVEGYSGKGSGRRIEDYYVRIISGAEGIAMGIKKSAGSCGEAAAGARTSCDPSD